MNHRLFILKFFAAVFLIGILSPSLTAFSQSSSPKSVQMDWEEIRDAQVQMLRKKEAELDRMKEELLTRAQPQAQIQSGLPEVEAEFKKQEAEWLQKSDRYENEITLLKVKIDEQKKEIELLRSQLSETLKKNQPGQQGKSDAQDLTRRELLIQIQKKELQDKQAEWESQKKQYQKVKGELARLGKEKIDFQNQAATWEASKLQVEQMHEAEKLQLQTDRQALEIQKEIFVKDKAGLAVETNNFQAKFKELQAASAQAQELVKRETVISSKEQQLSQKQASLDMREKGFRDSQNQIASWEASKLQVDQKQKAEQLQIETERRDFQTQKAALEKDRAALAVEKEVLHRQSEKLQDLSVQAKEITNHEVAVAAREQQWVQKQTELNEREKSIANVQNQVDEEKRLWMGQKAQVDHSLAEKLAAAEARFAQFQEAKKSSDWDRVVIAKQIAGFQGQLKTEKIIADERAVNWKKREQELLSAQNSGSSQIMELQSRLAKEKMDFSQKEMNWAAQQNGLSQKLAQSDAQLKAADLRLKDQVERFSTQNDSREMEWKKKYSELEKGKVDLSSLEAQLKSKGVALDAQALQIDEKARLLRQEQQQFADQKQKSVAFVSAGQTTAEVLQLKQKLQQVASENEVWRRNKRELEQNWSDFVNKEMQYQMQIAQLEKENRLLQQKVAAKKT